jgi:magnesium-transporting ATPase (P-type)
VNTFVTEYLNIEVNEQPIISDTQYKNTQIKWRDMQYLWKNFLESKKLPSIMFLQTLKTHLIDKLKIYYNETIDSFVGICSKHLPEIQKFLQYWEETILFDENEMDFEIEEVILLFRKWCLLNNEFATNLNDKQILDVISYFYPTTEIEHDKYISKIRSILWDKQMDIQVALDNMRTSIREKISNSNSSRVQSPSITNNISIYDAYKYYCKYLSNINEPTNKLIVSKSYFEKYIFDTLPNYIIDSKFISIDWVTL